MEIQTFWRNMMLMLVTIAMAGCGGGGGGGAAPAVPVTTATAAVLKVSVAGTLPAATSIGAVDVIVNLPAGVTAKADTITGETGTGVVVASGSAIGSTVLGKYTAATPPAPGTIRIGLINSSGFTTGEVVTLNLDLSGASPSAGDFTTSGLSVISTDGPSIGGMTAALSLQLF